MKYRLSYFAEYRDDALNLSHEFEAPSHEQAKQMAQEFIAAKNRKNANDYRAGKISRDDLVDYRFSSVGVITQEMQEVVRPI